MATTTFMEPGTDATQDLSLFASTSTGGTGAIASDTSRSHTGPRAIKFTQGAGLGASRVSSTSGCLVDTGAQIGFWMNFDTLPGGSAQQVMVVRSAPSTTVFDVRLNASGTAEVNPAGVTPVDGTTAMVVNTWYWWVVSYYITNTTTYQIKLYIHAPSGALIDTITANSGTLTRTGTSFADFGNVIGNWANNSNLWVDDIFISKGGASSGSQPDLVGPISVTAKRPNANGTTNNFDTQIGVGGSGYGTGHSPQVNEQPLSTTNGWSKTVAGVAITEEYNIEAQTVGDVNIAGVTILDTAGWVYAKSGTAETAQLVLNNATTNISLTTSNASFMAFGGGSAYPAGTGTDIGLITATTSTTVSLYECGVLVAYIPDVGGWYGSFPVNLNRSVNVSY